MTAPDLPQTDDPAAAAEMLVNGFVAAWNVHDMAALSGLMTPDVHWVNTVGMHWRGRDEVHRAHAAFHATMFKTVSIHLEEIESVTPVNHDAAIAVCRTGVDAFNTPTGLRPPSRDRLTVVIQRRPEGWAIAHGANVPIFEAAQAHDPARLS
jgi:uncharacterized protein (TIGR02246 family)